MKKLLVIIVALGSLLMSKPSLGQHEKKGVYIISPGKGTDKFQIGKTAISVALSMLGTEFTFSQGISDLSNGDAIYNNSYRYYKLGITIEYKHYSYSQSEKTDTTRDTINAISFTRPLANAKTKEGVKLNSSNLQDIEDAYGEPDFKREYLNQTDVSYYTKGISFEIDKTDNKVKEISIFIPRPIVQDTGAAVTMMGKISKENFVSKGNKPVKGVYDYWFISGNMKYFIKEYGSAFTKDTLNIWAGQTVQVKAIVKNGEWDTTNDSEKQQSRVGEYLSVLAVKKI